MKPKINEKPKVICFDVDDTIWRIRRDKKDQVPDHDLIALIRWFHMNGDFVYVWSAGGVDYAEQICRKFGLDDYITGVIPKGENPPDGLKVDLVFDDEITNLGKVDIHVQREGKTEY